MGTLKVCTVGTVKSVILRFCSNTTAKVKRKTKDVQPGRPPKLWFVIHDSEQSLQSLESNWDLVHVQTKRKIEPCYNTLGVSLNQRNCTPSTPTENTGTNVLKVKPPLLTILPRVHNSKSVQLPYGFYTRHLDRMT